MKCPTTSRGHQRTASALPRFANSGFDRQRTDHAVGRSPGHSDTDEVVGFARQLELGYQFSFCDVAQQVLLEVRFIEISRTAGRELGVQWNRFGESTITNVGNRVSANNLPLTAATIAGETAAGVLSNASRSLPCWPYYIGRCHYRRDDQRARTEGHRAQSCRAQSGGALG